MAASIPSPTATFFDPIDDEPQLWFDAEKFPDRQALLDQLSQAIAKCRPPQVFGVHGDWGTGKTSFLHRLQHQLTGECLQNRGFEAFKKRLRKEHAAFPNVTAVWFEAWRYQHEAAPIVALLQEMRAQLEKKRSYLEKMVAGLGGETAVAMNAALLALEDLTGKLSLKLGPLTAEVRGKGPRLREARQQWESDNLAAKLPSHHIREHLESILDALLPGEPLTKRGRTTADLRLVIFIDDLDRCEPEAAFRLLESIKIYLNLRNCVFVLGLNQREIERAIATVLPKQESSGTAGDTALTRAHEYIEKLCGNIVRLPLLSPPQQQALLGEWFEKTRHPQVTAAICRLLDTHTFLPANPRRIKAFANFVARTLLGREKLAGDPEQHARALAIVASLYVFHPRLYAALERSPADFFRVLQEYCDADFNNPLREREHREACAVPLLTEFIRPYSVTWAVAVAEPSAAAGQPGAPLAPATPAVADPDRAATPAGASAEGAATDKHEIVILPLFADATALNVLHCQSLIAESELKEDDLRVFLAH